MAAVKSLVGEKILIQIEDVLDSGVFAHDCLINADRGLDISSDVSEMVVPDCDDPSLPAFKEIFKDGISLAVSGGGVLHTSSVESWFNWMITDSYKNVRVKLDTSGALGGGYIAMRMKLTGFSITGARKNNSTAEVSLMSHGVATWVDNP